jgi:[acyl-carrier-protein] S-malonyltransferase
MTLRAGVVSNRSTRIAWVFPGQGAQFVGMGRDVASASSAAATVYAEVDAALTQALGKPLSSLCFEGPDAELVLTKHTQPAIVATSIALLAAAKERLPSLPEPAFVAGHSLGEYAAIVAAGGLSVADACRIVHRRGEAMQAAVPPGEGAMAAVMGIDPSVLEAVCLEAAGETGEVVSPANFNAPGQIVIAGGARGVAKANELVGARKGKAIPLKVSAPFHCALMKPAAAVVADALAQAKLSALTVPVVSNVDATPRTEPEAVRDALVRQVDAPVRWQTTIESIVAAGVTHVIEIGPGKVLQGLVKRIAKDVKLYGVGDAASLDGLGAFVADAG